MAPGDVKAGTPDELVYCNGGAYLVGTKYSIARAGDPALTAQEAVTRKVRGCGALVCGECQEPVRRWDGRQWRWEVQQSRAAEVYDADDAERFQRPNAEYRAYACRCQVRDCSGSEGLMDSSLPHPWRCSGHLA